MTCVFGEVGHQEFQHVGVNHARCEGMVPKDD